VPWRDAHTTNVFDSGEPEFIFDLSKSTLQYQEDIPQWFKDGHTSPGPDYFMRPGWPSIGPLPTINDIVEQFGFDPFHQDHWGTSSDSGSYTPLDPILEVSQATPLTALALKDVPVFSYINGVYEKKKLTRSTREVRSTSKRRNRRRARDQSPSSGSDDQPRRMSNSKINIVEMREVDGWFKQV
jgi:hypothetical protein